MNINNIKEVLGNLVSLSRGYFLTTVINQALPFLLLPILTRFLSVGEFGMLSLMTFFMSICTALMGISTPTVVSKYFFDWEKEEIARLVGNCIYTVALWAIIILLVLSGATYLYRSYIPYPIDTLFLLPISSFSLILFSLGLTICRNTKSVFHFSCHQIGNTVINIILSLILVCVLIYGWIGRFYAICVANIISAVIMLFFLKRKGFLSFSYSRDMQKEIRRVVMPLIPNSIQLNMISQAGLFIMQLLFGDELLGKYAMAFQLSFCIKLLIDTLNMSWSPFLFSQLSDSTKMDRPYVSRLLLLQIGVLALGVLFINVAALPILKVMTTPSYYAAKEYMPYFTMGWFFYGIYVFLQPILIKHNRQKLIAGVSCFSMVFMIAANLILAQLLGPMGVALAFGLVYFVLSFPLILKAHQCCPLLWGKK